MDHLTLVTGSSGFIGGHLAHLLSQEGRNLRLLLRQTSQTKHLQHISHEPAYGDLRDPAAIGKAMAGVETVYHVAALYQLWTKRKRDFFDINAGGTKNMCEAALKAGVKKFIYTSTTGAIGISDDPARLDEKTPWKNGWTDDPYVLSKHTAEEMVKDYIKKGLPAVIVNPCGPIGPDDRQPSPAGKMICDFLNGKLPGYVEASFAIVDVRDAAKGHLLAEQKGKIGERYIVSGPNLNVKDFMTQLAFIAKMKPPRIKVPLSVMYGLALLAEGIADYITRRPPPVTRAYVKLMSKYFWFDNSKSQKELGLVYHPFEQTLRDTVTWFCKNGFVKSSVSGRSV